MSKSSNTPGASAASKASLKSAEPSSGRFAAAGQPVRCPHCGGAEFDSREILLNTRTATFFNFDWLNRGATTLRCRSCGRIEWFAVAPQKA